MGEKEQHVQSPERAGGNGTWRVCGEVPRPGSAKSRWSGATGACLKGFLQIRDTLDLVATGQFWKHF